MMMIAEKECFQQNLVSTKILANIKIEFSLRVSQTLWLMTNLEKKNLIQLVTFFRRLSYQFLHFLSRWFSLVKTSNKVCATDTFDNPVGKVGDWMSEKYVGVCSGDRDGP